MEIPTSPDHFTPGWMTAALRSSSLPATHEVVSVAPSSLGEGFGLLGSLARLSVGYDRHAPGAPTSVIAKFPAVAEFNHSLACQYRVYEREVRFYTQVAPTVRTRVPVVHYSQFDEATGDAVILLEDLAPARVGDQLVPPSEPEVAAAMDEIASLHAAWWGRAGADEVAWVPRLDDPIWLQVAGSMEVFWPNFQQNFGHLLSPTIRSVGDRFAANIAGIAERLCRPPLTLLHGDYRLDNLFFAGTAAEPELTVIDWQLISRGRGPYDIAYFMSQGLEPARRKETEREVLRRYHSALVAGGVGGYDFADCWEDYRLATLWCLMYPVAAGGGIDLANERGTALATAMATRSFAAIEDLGAAELLEA